MYDLEANRGPHPSESIPNAAYPESNYRPGTGTIPSSSSASASTTTWTQHAPAAVDDASDPPPPYVPSDRPPQRPTPVSTNSTPSDGIPLSTLPSLPPVHSPAASTEYLQPEVRGPSSTAPSDARGYFQPEVQGNEAGRPSMQSTNKYDNTGLWQSRQRRARRAKICGISSGVVCGVVFAVILAVAFVAWRANHNGW